MVTGLLEIKITQPLKTNKLYFLRVILSPGTLIIHLKLQNNNNNNHAGLTYKGECRISLVKIKQVKVSVVDPQPEQREREVVRC